MATTNAPVAILMGVYCAFVCWPETIQPKMAAFETDTYHILFLSP